MKFPLTILLLIAMLPQTSAEEKTHQAEATIAQSPIIGIVSILKTPPLRYDDASLHTLIWPQKARAWRIRSIWGELPKTFTIRNHPDSILTPGVYLAFMQPIADGTYRLSTPIALRRIHGNQVYGFHDKFENLDSLLSFIEAKKTRATAE